MAFYEKQIEGTDLFKVYPTPRVAKFEKVSREQFKKDVLNYMGNVFNTEERIEIIDDIYDSIKLPVRATKYSAGYDFFSPISFKPTNNSGIVIPTGIRCKIDEGWVLKVYPRSGQGFKYGLHLYNTVGIIDGDYYNSDNEGHIMMKISCKEKDCDIINQGVAFCQGIFEVYGLTEDDNVTTVRNGGLGSTSKE